MSDVAHIVGIVGGDITIDSRVKKTAAAAAAAGYRSTIVCYTPEGTRRDSQMGDVTVIRIPVPFVVRQAAGRVPVPLRPLAATELAQRRLAPRSRHLARKRRLTAKFGETKPGSSRRTTLRIRLEMLRVNMKLRQEAYRLRSRGHVVWDRFKRRALVTRLRLRNRVFRRFNNPVLAIYDYEVTFGPVIEELRPNLIHAHDYHMIGVAVTAACNLRRDGLETKVVYDAHELVEGLSYPPRVTAGWLAEEEAHIHRVDAVVGVSPEQTRRIKERYGLASSPTVTLNAPIADIEAVPTKTIRDHVGASGPILVYHGNATPERGVFTLIDAMSSLPEDVHVAFIIPGENDLTAELRSRAAELGASQRLHFLDFVPAEELPGYLATADIEVIPYLPSGNHNKTLPNKLFEALQANLPILASDMEALGGFVQEHGVGRVFEPGSATGLAAEAVEILQRAQSYRDHITTEIRAMSSWDAQAAKLVELYQRLLGDRLAPPRHIRARDVTEQSLRSQKSSRPTRVAIGPRNMAGQAYMLASAIQSNLGIPAFSFAVDKPVFHFPVHQQISPEKWRDPVWQLRQKETLASGFTHVLAESGTGVLGALNGGFIDEQLPILLEEGLKVGLLFHGSELRDPRRHVNRPFSPYAVNDELTRSLEQATARLRRHLEGLDLSVFVTTPDLLQDIDGAWLPVVVDHPRWSAVSEPFTEAIPTVLHLPSRSRLKGSEHIDPVLARLEEEGGIRYLRPKEKVNAADVIQLIEAADIVIDGIVIGAYGIMSCQALAGGRLAIANLSELSALQEECPIIDANPGTLDAVLRDLIADRDSWKQMSEAGKEYALKYHSGSHSAGVLRSFLGLNTIEEA